LGCAIIRINRVTSRLPAVIVLIVAYWEYSKTIDPNHLHLNMAGYQKMAEAIDLDLFKQEKAFSH
jgi:lysophospholipase L1-like esterase